MHHPLATKTKLYTPKNEFKEQKCYKAVTAYRSESALKCITFEFNTRNSYNNVNKNNCLKHIFDKRKVPMIAKNIKNKSERTKSKMIILYPTIKRNTNILKP